MFANPHYRICAAAFCIDVALMTGLVATPFLVYEQLGGDADMAGVILGAMALMYALSCVLSANVLHRASNPMTLAVFGAGGFTLAFSTLPLWGHPVLVGLSGVAATCSLAFVWPAIHAWVGSEPDLEQRSRRMSLLNVSWSTGFTLSPPVAGMLSDADIRYPFIMLFIFGAVGALLLWSIPAERDFFTAQAPEPEEERGRHDRKSEAYLYMAWFATFIGNVLSGATRSVYSKHIENLVEAGALRLIPGLDANAAEWLGPATSYSILVFFLSGAMALSFVVLGRTPVWRHRFRYVVAMQLIAAAAFFLLSWTSSLVVMALCFIVLGVNQGASFFAASYYGMANPSRKQARAGLHETAVGAGGFAGSAGYGLAANPLGLLTAFRWTPLIVGAAILAEAGLLKLGRKRFIRDSASAGKAA
jgi:MFS family permease